IRVYEQSSTNLSIAIDTIAAKSSEV
uniref:Uncharacterized protein n=1 Tax=Caenorhabditis japonica TaxID=281687 RepID=A0A8R1IRL7_CAEJA